MEDTFSMGGWGGWDGSGGNASGGDQWGAAEEALLAHPLLTSCCSAPFLTGRGRVLVGCPGLGDPCWKGPKGILCLPWESSCPASPSSHPLGEFGRIHWTYVVQPLPLFSPLGTWPTTLLYVMWFIGKLASFWV